MTVPAGRVVPWDKKETIFGTEKIKSLPTAAESAEYSQEAATPARCSIRNSLESTLLHDFAAQLAPDPEVRDLLDGVSVQQRRSDRARRVE